MGIELVENKDPRGVGVEVDGFIDVSDEAIFCPRWADGRCDRLAGHHIKVRDQASRAVTFVLELATLYKPRTCRQCRVKALDSLNAGLLVRVDHMAALLMDRVRLGVGFANPPNIGIVLLGIFQFVL